MKKFLLDTSALMAMRRGEAGMDAVKEILRGVRKNKNCVFASTMSQLEFFYLTCRQHGKEAAYRTHLELKMLPIEFIQPDEETLLKAGEFKAECAFSLADAIIAATASHNNATLVHKDPEFETLGDRMVMQPLPYKK